MPNVTARLSQQWTILIGNDIVTQVKNPNVSCTAVTRSCTERGIITNMGNQIQVWKHILDTLQVMITPMIFTETAMAFGWNKTHKPTKQQPQSSSSISSSNMIPSNQCGVMIGLPPYTPRSIIEHIMTIWYDEFQFQQVGFCCSTVAAAIDRPIVQLPSSSLSSSSQSMIQEKYGTIKDDLGMVAVVPIACVVDFGYSAIHVIPIYKNKVISSGGRTHETTIRRIPFGGKHMINLLKYYCSYRQWNLMDSEWIVRDVFEKTAFVSTSFLMDMKLAQKVPNFGKRPFDCEYILPNYDTTFVGQVQIPESVQIEIERRKQHQNSLFHTTVNNEESNDDADDDEEDDEDYNENDMNVDDNNDDGSDSDTDGTDDDDENESPEQIRQRLLQQREDERRRREVEAEQHQILNVSTERFAIPEALFRPSDMGLPPHWANVPQAIVQSIEACPPIYRPGLYRSIQLTGGLSQLPNLKDRLLVELRAIVPCQYPLNITINDSPVDQAWNGIANITRQEPYKLWGVSRDEWEAQSRRGAWKRLQMNKGGYLI
jgi:actin-related protein